jgi:chromosome segregation ATPase
VAVVLFAWALSLYTNRLDWFDRTLEDGTKIDGQLAQLQAEVKRSGEQIKASQLSDAGTTERLKYTENVRDFRKATLAGFMAKIQGVDNQVKFLELQRMEKSALLAISDKPDANGIFDPLGTDVNGLNNKPLLGLGTLRKKYGELSQDMLSKWDTILKLRAEYAALSDDIEKVQYEVIRQKVIFENLNDEQDYLADAQINWEEQLRILEVRKSQLMIRLDALAGSSRTGK